MLSDWSAPMGLRPVERVRVTFSGATAPPTRRDVHRHDHAVNTALAGLSFTPRGPTGRQSAVITNDMGNTGSGGAQSDDDTIAITVRRTSL